MYEITVKLNHKKNVFLLYFIQSMKNLKPQLG